MVLWHPRLRCAHLRANSCDYYVTVQRGLIPAVVARFEPVRDEEVASEPTVPRGGEQRFLPLDFFAPAVCVTIRDS